MEWVRLIKLHNSLRSIDYKIPNEYNNYYNKYLTFIFFPCFVKPSFVKVDWISKF